jgi:hypothetical protein
MVVYSGVARVGLRLKYAATRRSFHADERAAYEDIIQHARRGPA